MAGFFFVRLMSAFGRKQTLADASWPQISPSCSFQASECPLTTQSGHSIMQRHAVKFALIVVFPYNRWAWVELQLALSKRNLP